MLIALHSSAVHWQWFRDALQLQVLTSRPRRSYTWQKDLVHSIVQDTESVTEKCKKSTLLKHARMKNSVFLALVNNRSFGGTYHIHHQGDKNWHVTTNVVPSSPILVTLIMEAIRSSETSVLTRATRRNISVDSILHNHRSANHKSYMSVWSSERNPQSWEYSHFPFSVPVDLRQNSSHMENTLNSVENFVVLCTSVPTPASKCCESQNVFWEVHLSPYQREQTDRVWSKLSTNDAGSLIIGRAVFF
jgi:hypothetical protein